MELMTKQGFKQTEVGLIPEDWDAKRIGDIALIERGKFTPRPRNNPIYYGGEIPFVQTGDVTRCNGKISHYSQTLNKIGLGVSKLFPKGSILMTIAANIGYTGVLQIDMACPDSLIGINGKQVENEFLNFYFQFRRNEIEELSTSGAQKNLNIELFRPFLIPLPPTLTEQKAIATALSDVDALIASLEQTITKKKAIKQGAMQQLLTPPHKGGKRLPGFEGEWVEKKLGDIFNFKQGLQCAVEEQYETEKLSRVRFIRIIDLTNTNEPPRYILKPDNSHIINKEDLFMVRYGTPGLLGYGYSGVIANNLFRLIPSVNLNSEFYYHLLKYKNQDILNLSSSTTMAAISFGPLNQMNLNSPIDVEEQQAIAQSLSDMDAEITQLETKKEKYQAIKQGMMQELLTGKTRLIN